MSESSAINEIDHQIRQAKIFASCAPLVALATGVVLSVIPNKESKEMQEILSQPKTENVKPIENTEKQDDGKTIDWFKAAQQFSNQR